jgi:polyisoprenoid-binding protein YceI
MTMKKIILCAVLTASLQGLRAQDIYFTRTGKIEFHAGTSVEDVDGVNNEAASMLNIKTGELVFTVLVKSFHFKRALMEEHFNENYMESTLYPKASYKGKITNLPSVNFSVNGQYNVQTEGELTMHNVTRKVTAPARIIVQNGKITGQSTFKVLLSDYKIAIPGIVQDKIAKEAEIIVNCIYEPK